MARKPKKHGRTKHMRDKAALEERRGSFKDDGKNWNTEMYDALLELHLNGAAEQTIANELERPVATIPNKLWKLASGYLKARFYKPGPIRTKRRGPLTKRELEIYLCGMKGDGQKIIVKKRPTPVDLEHIANLLHRDVDDLRERVKPKVKKGFGLL